MAFPSFYSTPTVLNSRKTKTSEVQYCMALPDLRRCHTNTTSSVPHARWIRKAPALPPGAHRHVPRALWLFARKRESRHLISLRTGVLIAESHYLAKLYRMMCSSITHRPPFGGGGYFIVVSEDDERLREDDERSRMAAVAVFAPGRARLKATFT